MNSSTNVYNLIENNKLSITLSAEEVAALKSLENKLASLASNLPDDEEDDDTKFKLIFQSNPLVDGDTYFLSVNNAIGQIILGDKIFNVSPKIKDDHFVEIYNLDKNNIRDLVIDENQGTAAEGDILYLIINDFLNGVERVVTKGIRKGYKQIEDELKFIKGRVNVLSTSRNLLSGKLAIKSEFEEFTIDIALNRIIKSALKEIKTLTNSENTNLLLNYEVIISKANILYRHFEFIPEYKYADLKVQVDRNTKYYGQAVVGAKNILQSLGAEVTVGDTTASARLMNTFSVVENGIRYFLNQNLPEKLMCNAKEPAKKYSDRGKYRLNPDLVFGYPQIIATGDIKYKFWNHSNKVKRSDFQQAITFATGYKVTKCIVIGFSDSSYNTEEQQDEIGEINYNVATWNTDLNPSESGELLLNQVKSSLEKEIV